MSKRAAPTETPLEMLGRVGAKYIARKLVKAGLPDDFPTADRVRLEEATANELKVTMAAIGQRLRRAAAAPPVRPVSMNAEWTRVLTACRVLVMKPPKKYGLPSDLAEAGKNRKAALKAYHPDINPGHETEYTAVNNAYDILEQYNERLLHAADAKGAL